MRLAGLAAAGLFLLAAQPAPALDATASHDGQRGRPHTCDWLYSPQMQSDGLTGSAIVAFRVTEHGGTNAIRLARTSGHDFLDRLAKECVAHWKYKPATHDGAPMEVEWVARIDFGTPGYPLNSRMEEVVVPSRTKP
jgi:TonB family protein